MGEKSDNGTFKEGKDFSWGWLLFFFVLLLVACIAYPFILRGLVHWMNPGKLDKYGLVGDMFGALNAFISGCAFIGVIISLYLQRQDLKLQKKDLALQLKEMREARKEAEEQTKQFKEQVEIGKLAQFSDAFYRRVELLQSLRNYVIFEEEAYISGKVIGDKLSGVMAWQMMHDRFLSALRAPGYPLGQLTAHRETLSGISAWHKTFIMLIHDTITYFHDYQYSDNANLTERFNHDEASHYIRVVLNTFTKYEKDFMLLLFDLYNEESPFSEGERVKRYLYKHQFFTNNDISTNIFACGSERRKNVLAVFDSFLS